MESFPGESKPSFGCGKKLAPGARKQHMHQKRQSGGSERQVGGHSLVAGPEKLLAASKGSGIA